LMLLLYRPGAISAGCAGQRPAEPRRLNTVSGVS
jgi:hypothetical protein